jgi:hypothetical protein
MSVRDGYGPTVSLGVTAQAALLGGTDPATGASTALGAVGESPHAAASVAAAEPMIPKAARRLSCLD